jgi:DNA-binding IclR family transcriptional regulator
MDDLSPSGKAKRRRGVASLEVGGRVLSALADAGKAMMLKDIAAATGMPPAKVHRYLASFVRTAMVSQDEASGRYDLGPFAARLGVAALARHDVIKRATGQLALLRNDIRETCFLSCWSDAGPMVFRWEDSLRPLTVNVLVGSIMPLLRSATGRVFLAFMPWSRLSGLLADELSAAGMSEAQAGALAAAVRERGLAPIEGELQADIDALAAPLFDQSGHMVGSVTALGRSGKFDISQDGAVAQRLRAFTKKVSS